MDAKYKGFTVNKKKTCGNFTLFRGGGVGLGRKQNFEKAHCHYNLTAHADIV